MIWKISLILVMFMCQSCEESKSNINAELQIATVVIDNNEYFSNKHLIEFNELEHLGSSSDIKIIDFRQPQEFSKEHIKGAINIWRTDIEDGSFPYTGIMATKIQIEKLFSGLGIRNEDMLVIYDDNGSCDTSRLWWILKNYGFERTKILNGGLGYWKSNNGDISTEVVTYKPSKFNLPSHSKMQFYIGLKGMRSILNNNSNIIILDTRTDDEFSGKRQKNGAFSGGRIPNSILIDWSHSVDYDDSNKFKSYNDLLELYNLKGVTKDKNIYVYCHSGVRSAHTTFVITELLGFKNVKNYDGSWVEWSYHKELPIEKDSITTIFK